MLKKIKGFARRHAVKARHFFAAGELILLPGGYRIFGIQDCRGVLAAFRVEKGNQQGIQLDLTGFYPRLRR